MYRPREREDVRIHHEVERLDERKATHPSQVRGGVVTLNGNKDIFVLTCYLQYLHTEFSFSTPLLPEIQSVPNGNRTEDSPQRCQSIACKSSREFENEPCCCHQMVLNIGKKTKSARQNIDFQRYAS